jgi:hypothetical protein
LDPARNLPRFAPAVSHPEPIPESAKTGSDEEIEGEEEHPDRRMPFSGGMMFSGLCFESDLFFESGTRLFLHCCWCGVISA